MNLSNSVSIFYVHNLFLLLCISQEILIAVLAPTVFLSIQLDTKKHMHF